MKDSIEMIKKAKEAGEPTFTIRAKDYCALEGLSNYYIECIRRHCSDEYTNEIGKVLIEFRKWKENNPHKMKIPD